MTTWICRDDQGPEVLIEADRAAEAAQEYVDQGDYGQASATETTWVPVRCTPSWRGARFENETEYVTIAIHPVEPACADGHEHDWCAPHELLGGIPEAPGAWGHGGGVVSRDVCRHCGVYRVTDTDAQDAAGAQGLVAVSYEDADEESLAWVASAAHATE